MLDTFATFEDLSKQMVEGTDYRIVTRSTSSPYLIVAIHGGSIETLTSEIATAIAGEEHSLYLFEGMRNEGNDQLHIGSCYFNEPRLSDMLRSAEVVVSIHGQQNKEKEFVTIGGRSQQLIQKVADHLYGVNILVRQFEARMDTESPENACNKGMSGEGVEMEISEKLRDALREDAGMFRLLTNAVRHAVEAN